MRVVFIPEWADGDAEQYLSGYESDTEPDELPSNSSKDNTPTPEPASLAELYSYCHGEPMYIAGLFECQDSTSLQSVLPQTPADTSLRDVPPLQQSSSGGGLSECCILAT